MGFVDIIIHAIDKFVPKNYRKVKNCKINWSTTKILRHQKMSYQLRKKQIFYSELDQDSKNYKVRSKKVTALVRRAQRSYYYEKK